MTHPSAAHLPRAMVYLAPELAAGPLPDEPLADCSSCPMAGRPFLPDVRCCTYHPVLPNFLAGAALRRGGAGAARVRARLLEPDGLARMGIGPPHAWRKEYRQKRDEHFGRRREWTCPYWQSGPLSCSIWPDRNSTCRSWHCKHADGAAGQRVWSARRTLGRHVESALARWAAGVENGPPAEGWEAWFVDCAERVDALDEASLDALRDDLLDERRRAVEPVDAAIPEVVTPHVRDVVPLEGGRVSLVGYSDWDPAELPSGVFALLAALDGRPWREAAAAFEEGEAWVRVLWRHGAVRSP